MNRADDATSRVQVAYAKIVGRCVASPRQHCRQNRLRLMQPYQPAKLVEFPQCQVPHSDHAAMPARPADLPASVPDHVDRKQPEKRRWRLVEIRQRGSHLGAHPTEKPHLRHRRASPTRGQRNHRLAPDGVSAIEAIRCDPKSLAPCLSAHCGFRDRLFLNGRFYSRLGFSFCRSPRSD